MIDQFMMGNAAEPGLLVLGSQARKVRFAEGREKHLDQQVFGILRIGKMPAQISQDRRGMLIKERGIDGGYVLLGIRLLHTCPLIGEFLRSHLVYRWPRENVALIFSSGDSCLSGRCGREWCSRIDARPQVVIDIHHIALIEDPKSRGTGLRPLDKSALSVFVILGNL